jgi:uncharacterized protein with HEPN domain
MMKFHGDALQVSGHDYMGVDIDAVWQITQKEIPELEVYIRRIIKDLEKNH